MKFNIIGQEVQPEKVFDLELKRNELGNPTLYINGITVIAITPAGTVFFGDVVRDIDGNRRSVLYIKEELL